MAENKGVWLDTKTSKVVTSQPEEGVQLISPDVEPTPNELAVVEATKAALSGDSEAQTVTTQTVKTKK